jgi:hypothetical protein
MVSRLPVGTTTGTAEREALEWKVCMSGRGRLEMLGCVDGRAVVVRPREDFIESKEEVSILNIRLVLEYYGKGQGLHRCARCCGCGVIRRIWA